MTVEQDIRSTLFGDLTVGGQVGSTSATARIYFGVMAQDTEYPAIQVEEISTIRSHNVVGGATRYTKATYQVTCWDTTYGKAKTLANNVKAALDGITTPFAMLLANERDLYDTQARLNHIVLDFIVMTGC
jgi:hypothetical protein